MTYLPIDEQLFDYICDYVDGTMEPSVQEVFEQYLRQNPDIMSFVDEAEQGRNLLVSLPRASMPDEAKRRIKDQLKIKLIIEEAQEEEKAAPSRLSPAGLITFLAILVGMLLLAVVVTQ